ncbi:peptidylprolyl isomerase [Roseateles noduli]|jgi:peptidyl-prolyl cis-trans isomerase A (cyclophilin A)|uniref:peptidylprolyl isomerase n=1 Tax=Roseateles noduli TaxID=2052484 RepID=UPI003D653B97
MKSITLISPISSKPRLLALSAALGGALMLAACGGGSDNDSGNPVQTPKPNPVPVAPTTSCSAAGIAASNASTAARVVCMLTSDGEMVVELDARTPITTANFLKYVNAKYYDNTIFHRVVPGFVAQGGGFITGYVAKAPGTDLGGAIKLETNVGVSNVKYTIAMARTSVADSATSQFFFNSVDNSATLDYKTAADPGYAAFGRVISGQATVDKINAEPQLYSGAETPATEVLLYWAIQLK